MKICIKTVNSMCALIMSLGAILIASVHYREMREQLIRQGADSRWNARLRESKWYMP